MTRLSTINDDKKKIPRTTRILLRCLPMVGETFVPLFLTERFSFQPRLFENRGTSDISRALKRCPAAVSRYRAESGTVLGS